MVFRVEWRPMRIDHVQLVTLKRVEEQLERQLHALAHPSDRLIIRIGQLKTTLQTVQHRQQIAGEFL